MQGMAQIVHCSLGLNTLFSDYHGHAHILAEMLKRYENYRAAINAKNHER
jgi:hypothetical protein